MPKATPRDIAASLTSHANTHPQDRAPQRHANRAPQNHTTNSPKRQQDKPGCFGRHAVKGTHTAVPAERVYADGIETVTKPNGRTVRVKDTSERRWTQLYKQVSKGARVTVR